VRPAAVAVVSAGTLAVAAIAGFCVSDGERWLLWPAAVVVAVAGSTALLRHTIRRFGGITGDVLGALAEIGFTLTLLVLAAR
jgi:adenosylcobinamide-GDP ribazoletransferase